jgi:hypothetical protein
MVNKALFLPVLLLVAASSFAQDMQNRYLFIEGTASTAEHLWYFQSNFSMEADGAGYVVTKSKREAAHTLQFNVAPYDGPDAYQYVITISLFRNEDDYRLITFDFFFTTLEDMYQHNRVLFLNATVSIPIPHLTQDYLLAQEQLNSQWKNKWIYFRGSFDYPITFYLLQDTGLKGGAGLYNTSSSSVAPIDHEIMVMPGATLGAEFHLLNYLSLELHLHLSMGDTRNNLFVNLAVGFELKFPVKFQNIMLVPYGVFSYPLTVSPIFSEFPRFATGLGVQLCAKASNRSAFFVDVKYMFSFTDAVMHNPYLDFPSGQQLFPEPPVIHYKRSYLGIGLGYKIGILDR